MERRVSPRTKTRLALSIRRGKLTFTAQCIELSQTGLLAEVPRALRSTSWPYASARLRLGDETLHLLLRRVRVRGVKAAYAFAVLDESAQSKLTDHIFEVMHRALPPSRRRRLKRAA